MNTQEKKTTTLVLLLYMAMWGGLGGRCGTVNLCSLEKGNIEKTVLLSLKTRTHDETLVENSACCECGRAKISFFSMGVESTTGGEKWVIYGCLLAFSIQGGSRGGSDDETFGTKCAGYWNMFLIFFGRLVSAWP